AIVADRPTEHAAGVETHCIIAFGIQHDQPAVSADSGDSRQRIVRRLGKGSMQQPYLCGGVEGGTGTDEHFSGAGGGYRGRTIIGVGSGTDYGRVPDTSEALVRNPAG